MSTKQFAVILHSCIITYETFRISIYIINTIGVLKLKNVRLTFKNDHLLKLVGFTITNEPIQPQDLFERHFSWLLCRLLKRCQQYINESKFLIRLPLMKGMFDARKNFCNPMYFDLSVYSKATPSPLLLKVRSLIKLHCNGKKVRDSCCLSLEGG